MLCLHLGTEPSQVGNLIKLRLHPDSCAIHRAPFTTEIDVFPSLGSSPVFGQKIVSEVNLFRFSDGSVTYYLRDIE